ncbi:hypothetical protein M0R04_10890 [Candidatus Dojkabacteria bacterium]|jgi:hypothetical protein|nr:hypothetical protein [Candidatus Dojkabacteria bacterium]
MKKLKRVKVSWQDITSDFSWQEDIQEVIKDFKKDICESFGYVIYEDKDILVIAPDIIWRDKEIDRFSYQIIPKKPIKEIVVLPPN